MGKKNLLGIILALVMVATLCLDSYAIYARNLGESQEPAIENQVVKEEPGKDEKIEKPEKDAARVHALIKNSKLKSGYPSSHDIHADLPGEFIKAALEMKEKSE